jgi:hypothetical protein
MPSDQDLYHELMAYTLELRDAAFLHQHVVDAYTAQHADSRSKPIGVVFALVGLYLHLEKGYTGRQVQRAHTQLAGKRKPWPHLAPPTERGVITASDVVATPPGPERDARILSWCASVWAAWEGSRDQIRDLVKNELDVS